MVAVAVAVAARSSSSSSASSSSSSELGSLFAAFDADADGRISAAELRECVRATLGPDAAAVSAEEAEALVAGADADGDGLLDAAEFARLVAGLHAGAAEEDRHRGLRQAFRMYCSEAEGRGSSCITPASLRRMQICGATMLNLSLLTSDMWAVLIRIFAYHEKVDWIYFVAFAATAGGIVLYSYKGSNEVEETAQVAGASDEHGKDRDEEAGTRNPA